MSFFSRCLLALLLCVQSVCAQRALNTWSDHLSYYEAQSLDKWGDEVYAAAGNGLFIYNETDNSISRLSKVNGLSDIGISALAVNEEQDFLIIGYQNGNLDIIRDREITNFTAIKNSTIIGDKSIRHIQYADNVAYLSTGVGIIVFDTERIEVRDTYNISATGGIEINQTAILNDTIYAATSEGLYMADLGKDLTIFANWQQDLSIPSPFETVHHIGEYGGLLYLNQRTIENAGVYRRQNALWNSIIGTDDVISIKESAGGLTINTSYFTRFYEETGEILVTLSDYGVEPNMRANQAIRDTSGVLWLTDRFRGLVRYTEEDGYEFIAPEGPGKNSAFDLEIEDGHLWVAGGSPSHPGTWSNRFATNGFYKYFEGKWLNFLREDYTILDDELLFDIPIAYPDPDNPDRAYVGSWFSGLVTVDGDEIIELYDENNSSLGLREDYPSADWVGVAGIRKDDEGNIWMTNGFANRPLSVWKADGTWQSFNLFLGSNQLLLDLIINQDGNLWMVRNRGGVVAFNYGESIDNTADDEVTVFEAGAGNGGLPSDEVYCIAEDLDGEIWVGTDDGVAVFYSPFDAFSPNPSDARQILVEQDGIFQFLLEAQSVSAIAIDGANRKWIGTFGSGVFLLSEDGTEEVLRFTTENSPLYSDVINDIVIDNQTGEVFIATQEGIISYQGDAVGGELSNECNIVYPNPVRETYSGPISIEGLVRDSDVIITDTRGNLIASLVSNGGRAIWDGRNTNGERVATGVYFALVSDDSGESTCTTKILMIK